ncbi:hypothetical protein K438DRAFT_1968683 [Mycena galopus ATCC 62051]|nr:hypothetical protein K438DRAFT_1968683 [Mycena galopus ATCC 62051]
MVFPLFSARVARISPIFMAAQAYAASMNITFDDTNSTVWTFVGQWNAVTPSTPCPGCFAQPDPMQVVNSSWHDGSVVSGSVTFQGSAIYIYGIDMTATSGTNISFSMNNPSNVGFHYFGSTGTTYNVPFFTAADLDSSVEHTVSFIGQTSLAGAGAMLFDYAVVTVEQQDTTLSSSPSIAPLSTSSISPLQSQSASSIPIPTPTHKSNTGAIVGAIVGVVGALLILGALFLFLRRRRRAPPLDPNTGNYYQAPGRMTRMSAPGFTIEPYQAAPTNGVREASFIGEAPVSSPGVFTSASTPSSPELGTTPAASGTKRAAPKPPVLASRESEVEERLRRLESLVRPPQYNN